MSGYTNATCSAACSLVDPLLSTCLNANQINPSNPYTDPIECICTHDNDLPGHYRTRLLDSCAVCNEPHLGNHDLSQYQLYDLLCNIYSSPLGGFGFAGGESVRPQDFLTNVEFDEICLSQLRGEPPKTPSPEQASTADGGDEVRAYTVVRHGTSTRSKQR